MNNTTHEPSSISAPSPPADSVVSGSPHTIGQNNFDFCRFWLSIMVVFSHSFLIACGDETSEPMGVFTNGQLCSGPFAVCCFFAISGFLITHSWKRSKTTLGFLAKRVLRIYPGFLVAALAGLFLVAPFAAEHFQLSRETWIYLPINLAALRRVEPANVFLTNPRPGGINDSLWSIPYEFKCYLGVILLGSIGFFDRFKNGLAALTIAMIIGGCFYQLSPTSFFERGSFAAIIGSATMWFRVLPYFLAGCVAYVFRHELRLANYVAALAFAAFVIAAQFPPAGRLVFPFTITYLLFWFAFHPQIRFYDWSRYGDFSYGIYLYAFPMQQLLVMEMPGISPIALFCLTTPLAITAGAISWHFFEKHFLRLKQRPISLRLPEGLPPTIP